MRSTQRGLIWILLAAAAFLLFVALVAVVLFLVLRQSQDESLGWQDPVSEIVPDEITPDLALYPLAGASALETIDSALANGDLETAYAGLVFGLDLSAEQRSGRLIILGRKFSEAEQAERAARTYQQVYDLAILNPWLTDAARADALLASGKGWTEAGYSAEAIGAFDQVYALAAQSPYLQMANRRELLVTLGAAYRDLGEAGRAEACRQQVIRLDQESHLLPALPAQLPEMPGGERLVSSPDVGTLEEARRQAAYALIQTVPAGGDGEPPLGAVQDLSLALQDEDGAKLALVQEELAATTQPSRRIDVMWEKIRWLTLKYRVATRGYGLSVVPEWEAQAAAIQSELSKAYEDLFFNYEDLVTALPDASLMGPGSYVVRRQMNLSGRLGQYPNYPDQQMADKLRDAAMELIAGGAENWLFVDAISESQGLRFFLNPADRYGQPPQTP